jgi:hypothetical protein
VRDVELALVSKPRIAKGREVKKDRMVRSESVQVVVTEGSDETVCRQETRKRESVRPVDHSTPAFCLLSLSLTFKYP